MFAQGLARKVNGAGALKNVDFQKNWEFVGNVYLRPVYRNLFRQKAQNIFVYSRSSTSSSAKLRELNSEGGFWRIMLPL